MCYHVRNTSKGRLPTVCYYVMTRLFYTYNDVSSLYVRNTVIYIYQGLRIYIRNSFPQGENKLMSLIRTDNKLIKNCSHFSKHRKLHEKIK